MENTIKAVCDNVPTTYQHIIINKFKYALDYATMFAENGNSWDRVWYQENMAFIDGMLYVLSVSGSITQTGKDAIYDASREEICNIYHGALK